MRIYADTWSCLVIWCFNHGSPLLIATYAVFYYIHLTYKSFSTISLIEFLITRSGVDVIKTIFPLLRNTQYEKQNNYEYEEYHTEMWKNRYEMWRKNENYRKIAVFIKLQNTKYGANIRNTEIRSFITLALGFIKL